MVASAPSTRGAGRAEEPDGRRLLGGDEALGEYREAQGRHEKPLGVVPLETGLGDDLGQLEPGSGSEVEIEGQVTEAPALCDLVHRRTAGKDVAQQLEAVGRAGRGRVVEAKVAQLLDRRFVRLIVHASSRRSLSTL